MKKINLIIPYFGKFPNYFQLFLNSCRFNPTINWTIITDCIEEYDYPSNVKKIYMSFEEIKKKFQSKFDFLISLNSPYKLCDYKPAYGYIFSELNEGYDYWGHSDLDLIYGNLRQYLTDDVLSYDKLFVLGHFTLYRNVKEINTLFMHSYSKGDFYKTVYNSPESFNFDEQFMDKPNINDLFVENGKTVYTERFCADIYTKSSMFYLDLGDGKKEDKKNAFFLWNKGILYRFINENGNIEKKEYMYIHLQKRQMKVNIKLNTESYKIIPNSFEYIEVSNPKTIEDFKKIRKKRLNIHYFKIRIKNLKTKIQQRIKTIL